MRGFYIPEYISVRVPSGNVFEGFTFTEFSDLFLDDQL